MDTLQLICQYIFLGVLCSIPVGLVVYVVCIIREVRRDMKLKEQRRRDDLAWYEAEKNKPKFYLHVKTIEGLSYVSKQVEPALNFGAWDVRQTSYMRAKSWADSISTGECAFRKETLFIPPHRVSSIQVVLEDR